ncbi:MAG: FHA domain-containing protein [Chloroflexota bacterium]
MTQPKYKIVSIPSIVTFILLFGLFFPLFGSPPFAFGQAEPTELFLTQIRTDNLPKISLRVYGVDREGFRIDLSNTPLAVTHGNELVESVDVVREVEVGTFTVILVDTASGVQEFLPGMKEGISLYVENGYMIEPTDYIAIYQVGAAKAEELLEPTQFLNSVRNYLVDDLPVEVGSTALYDSLNDLLDTMDVIRPNPSMSTSIVVFSDGTDAISTSIGRNDLIEKADSAGIQVHTVLLENPFLSDAQLQEGGLFMKEMAFGTSGISTGLNIEGLETVWRSVASFHRQTIIEYQPTVINAETVPILVTFSGYPEIEAGSTVSIEGGAMLIEIPIPSDQRTLYLPDLSDPVDIQIPIEISWLGGVNNEVTSVQVWKGDQLIADPTEIGSASPIMVPITLENLEYGDFPIYVTASDTRGQRAESAAFPLTISSGDRVTVPPMLVVEQSGVRWTWWLGLISLPLLVIGLAYWIFTRENTFELPTGMSGFFDRFTRPRRGQRRSSARELDSYSAKSSASPNYDTGAQISSEGYSGYQSASLSTSSTSTDQSSQDLTRLAGGGQSQPGIDENGDPTTNYWFEIIESGHTPLNAIPLTETEHRIGRSPAQVDIGFPNEPTISRLHATLARELDAYRVFDEQSTSGTFVNGTPVPTYGVLLIDGDEIQVGEVILRYHCLS